jgi:hypothetical protein
VLFFSFFSNQHLETVFLINFGVSKRLLNNFGKIYVSKSKSVAIYIYCSHQTF